MANHFFNKISSYIICIGFLLNTDTFSFAQGFFPYHTDKIKSVYLTINGIQLYLPTIYLNEQKKLKLHLDYLDDLYANSLYAEIKICDQNWNPTDDYRSYYMQGSYRISLNSFETSTATHSEYAHIAISPFSDATITRSGNYVVHIYSEAQEDVPLYTQPIIISENDAKLSLSSSNNYFNFGQSASVQIQAQLSWEKETLVQNPIKNLCFFTLQNSDWNSWKKAPAIPMKEPKGFSFGTMGEIEMIKYAPFRYIQTNNFSTRGSNTSAASLKNRYLYVMIDPDFSQNVSVQHDYANYPGYSTSLFNVASLDKNTYGDYAFFNFSYKTNEQNNPLYVVGQFNQFRLDSTSLMKFNPITSQYESRQFIKQGHHQYIYTSVDNGQHTPPTLQSADQTTQHLLGVVYYFTENMKAPRILSVAEIYF